jgi:hypothetical protein
MSTAGLLLQAFRMSAVETTSSRTTDGNRELQTALPPRGEYSATVTERD